MPKHHVTTTINRDPVEFLCSSEQTLLDVLRDVLQLTGSKEGCASGDCSTSRRTSSKVCSDEHKNSTGSLLIVVVT